MQIFQNDQQFFAYIHQEAVKADDPTSIDIRDRLFANIFSEIRSAAMWGGITPRQYVVLHGAIKAAHLDLDREQVDLLGYAL